MNDLVLVEVRARHNRRKTQVEKVTSGKPPILLARRVLHLMLYAQNRNIVGLGMEGKTVSIWVFQN